MGPQRTSSSLPLYDQTVIAACTPSQQRIQDMLSKEDNTHQDLLKKQADKIEQREGEEKMRLISLVKAKNRESGRMEEAWHAANSNALRAISLHCEKVGALKGMLICSQHCRDSYEYRHPDPTKVHKHYKRPHHLLLLYPDGSSSTVLYPDAFPSIERMRKAAHSTLDQKTFDDNKPDGSVASSAKQKQAEPSQDEQRKNRQSCALSSTSSPQLMSLIGQQSQDNKRPRRASFVSVSAPNVPQLRDKGSARKDFLKVPKESTSSSLEELKPTNIINEIVKRAFGEESPISRLDLLLGKN